MQPNEPESDASPLGISPPVSSDISADVPTESTLAEIVPLPIAAMGGADVPLPPADGSVPGAAVPLGSPSASLWSVGTLVYTSAGIAVLFFWLLWGDFALSLRDRSIDDVIKLFLRSQHTTDFLMTVLMTFVPPIIGLVLGPIVSYRSDRLRSRWGRRIPYLIVATPIASAAMIGIAFCPALGQALSRAIGAGMPAERATLIVFGILWTIFEVAVIISASVLAGLINDVVPRGRLGRFYGMFRAVSLLDGMVFNYFLLELAKSHFRIMFVSIALVFGVGFLMMCLKVKEGEYPPPEVNPHDHRAGGFFAAVRIYFSECFSRPHYLWCFGAITLGVVTFLPVNTFSVYYRDQLGMDLGFYGRLKAYSYATSLCLAYPIGWLVDRFHPLRAGMAAISLYALTVLWGMMYSTTVTTFAIAFVAHTVLSGTYFTATASITQALLPRSKFAQFASAGLMVTSLVTMSIGPAMGLTMDLTNHNYRLTFVFAFILSLITLGVMAEVYRRMKHHGGIHHYVAPGDSMVAHTGGFPVVPKGGH